MRAWRVRTPGRTLEGEFTRPCRAAFRVALGVAGRGEGIRDEEVSDAILRRPFRCTPGMPPRMPGASEAPRLVLQYPASGEHHISLGRTTLAALRFHRLHDIHAIDHLAEDHMLAIEPGRALDRDEKL